MAFAFTGGHEVVCGDGTPLCEEFLHWAAKQRDSLPQAFDGTTLTAAASALRDLGQPPEHTWPYDDSRDVYDTAYAPSAQALQLALQRKLSSDQEIPPTIASIHAALIDNKVVVVGLLLYSPWHLPSADGFISLPTSSDIVLGSHAVTVVGSGSDANRRDYFIIRNSWGSSWGAAGYGYLQSEYIESYGIQAWDLGTFQ